MMKAERFTGALFLCVIVLFMCMMPTSFAVRKINYLLDTEPVVDPVNIEWEKLYPFSDDKIHILLKEEETLIERVKGKIEDYASKHLIGYYRIVEAAKKYEAVIGWNMASIFEYNPVMIMDDGYLTAFTPSRDVRLDANSLAGFSEFCCSRGIDFFYVNAPKKICKYDKGIYGELDFSNQNTDKLLAMLEESGVKYYDLRKTLHEEGMNHHKLFFATENHWTIDAGFWAAEHILRFLRDDYGWPVNPRTLSKEKFSRKLYPKIFLGAFGKKITLTRTYPDDFMLITPIYETSIKLSGFENEADKEGDFSVMLDYKELEPLDYYRKRQYFVYDMHKPVIKIENKLVRNGKKLLLVRDSFAGCVLPFLALGVQYVDAVDLRLFTGSIRSYVDKEKPDAVAVMYYSSMPGRVDTIRHKRIYDFR